MYWKNIRREHVDQAIDEYIKHGAETLRELYGFPPTKNKELYRQGKGPFEAKILIALAYSKMLPKSPKLSLPEFIGEKPNDFLVRLFGFEAHTTGRKDNVDV